MKLILVGWLAVGFALIWDRLLCYADFSERIRIGFLIPVGEEFLKFGMAYIANLNPFTLYFIFGCGEGLYEMFHSKKRMNFLILIAGILTHTFFGLFYLLKVFVWLSFLAALTCHLIWNNVIINLQNHYK